MPDEHLVFLGDYIDRGPDARGVIQRCIELQSQYSCTFLRGNHELYMLEWLREGFCREWMYNGGQETLASYQRDGGRVHVPLDHVAFLRSTHMYWDTPDYFFVHGGLPPERTVADSIRQCPPEELLWRRPPAPSRSVQWEKTVVFGHTPHPEPLIRNRMIGIDTGCVYGGRLTAVRLPVEKFVSVKNVDGVTDQIT